MFKNITGKRFTRLLAIRPTGKSTRSGKKLWVFLCDCGKEHTATSDSVLNGSTKSCGCYVKALNTKHGFTRNARTKENPFYSRWKSLRARCNNPKNTFFSYYGGRGIKCLWKTFEEFRDDMYDEFNQHVEQYGLRETTLDRIDPNGNYCRKNCRWSTKKEQQSTRRDSLLISYKGQTMNTYDWGKITGIHPSTLRVRIKVNNWPVEKAFNTPVRHKRKGIPK